MRRILLARRGNWFKFKDKRDSWEEFLYGVKTGNSANNKKCHQLLTENRKPRPRRT